MRLEPKILSGYLILVAVIVSMAAILLHECMRTREIASETDGIRSVRRSINAAHRQITVLATMGESVVGWDEEEYRTYHARRLAVDSLLQSLKRNCVSFVRPEQLDTLRGLLAAKETHLLRIMQSFRQRETIDSLLAKQLPTVVASK